MIRQIVLPQDQTARAKGVGLHGVAADREKAGMDLANHLRPGQDKILVAPFLPPEVVQGETPILDGCAHGPVEDQHAVVQGFREGYRRHVK